MLIQQPDGRAGTISQDRLKCLNDVSVEVTSMRSGRCNAAIEANCRRMGPKPTTCST